ncbi:MAG: (Fe-S)-binding protein [Trueperaceae bacterium]|nr:(Fe-S)-binding protein [Trueperaceae bacterium]
MLTVSEKLVFLVLASFSLAFAYGGFERVVRATARGARGGSDRTRGMASRVGAALVRTLSQVTVFRDRPWVSTFHAAVFYGFVFYLAVNLADVAKGLAPHAYTAWLGSTWAGPYRLAADVFTVAILFGMASLLVRRFVLRDPALAPQAALHPRAAAGGIRRDSLIVGTFITLHVGFRLLGEGFLLAAEGGTDAWQPFASLIAAGVGADESRRIGWHVGWWGAIGLVLAFLPYFPRSKHLHLLAAPVNFALERRRSDGTRMPSGALEPLDLEDESAETFGAERLEDLPYAQILDAYACIQCHRCTDACPAYATGKALSPSALEINKRYELTLVADRLAAGEATPRPLLGFAQDEEQIWACTTCGACIDACPVGNEPMLDIVDMRRERVLMAGAFPAELQQAFRGIERTGNPWGLGQDARLDWAEGMNVPTVWEAPDFEVLFWVGCAGAYDPVAQETTRAMARILDHAGVRYAVLGKNETCTGDPARRAGNEYLYYQLATENVAVLNDALADTVLDPARAKRVLTTCPHCYNALLNDYPQLGGDYQVVHHTEVLDELVQAERLPPLDLGQGTTYHDPCYLGRHNGVYDAPRRVLGGEGDPPREMPRTREKSMCCGAGGAQFWKEESPGREKVADARMAEARATGAEVVASACPFCKSMLGSAAGEEDGPEVLDVAQLYDRRLRSLQDRLSP